MDGTGIWVSKEIDGAVYSLTPLSPEKVLDHGAALISQVLAPALSSRAAMAFAAKDEGQKLALQMLAATTALLQNMSHPAMKAVFADLIKNATVLPTTGGELPLGRVWQSHFLGKSGALVQFLAWSLEEQFRDFFVSSTSVLEEAAKSLGARLVKEAPKEDAPVSASA